MKNTINWDDVPEILSMDQFRRLCHISKSTARFLLRSGIIPNEYSGKRTRCYKISKEEVLDYVAKREVCPEFFKASKNWYAQDSKHSLRIRRYIIEDDLHEYFAYLLKNYPDVLSGSEVSKISGYCKTTVNRWCHTNQVQHFQINRKNMIPKIFLIDFFSSPAFHTIARKSKWHVQILKNYAKWKYFYNRSTVI